MRGKLTYRQSQYLTCFKRPNATLTCKVQHTKHFLRRRMCSSIHTSGEFGIASRKNRWEKEREHARKHASLDAAHAAVVSLSSSEAAAAISRHRPLV